MNLLLGFLLLTQIATTAETFAQADVPATIQAYTTEDQIDPGRVDVATPQGRYAVRVIWCAPDYSVCVPWDGCEDIYAYENMLIWPDDQQLPWVGLSSMTADHATCRGYVEGMTSTVPCFTGDDGICDVNAEWQ